MKIILIGTDDNRERYWPPELLELIKQSYYFSGGKRHHELIKPYLPEKYEWIDVVPPVPEVVRSYEGKDQVVVIASCDPIFHGIGQRIMAVFPEAEIALFPYFNSLQMLAHKALLPYQEMHVVSLTGRPWLAFDEALIQEEKMIGILTDNRMHTPRTIASRMLEYGYDNYDVYVGELLGNKKQERVTKLTVAEVAERDFEYPNNLILTRQVQRKRLFGIPDKLFTHLDGRERMITKMPIRLHTLSMLELYGKRILWDVGSCTGSVSVEAKLQFPHLEVVAFEIRPEGEGLLTENARKFGAPGIVFGGGDFLEADLATLPAPDAVFIGGHGGKMVEIMERIWQVLADDGVVVFNSVSDDSYRQFCDAVERVGGKIEEETRLAVDQFNPIRVMKARK
ncbi:precorrin-6y C5,15-methyltransferase (decarboxylating) subunit CbiE [Porphyromonas levii]|uniref:precorrin-6y C5,15-methyltransferase (decarboxylating) subunit CbiE n=1 Tax=Porphyromonas levii TaxID=28114 RepID=UPI001B8AB787|nr:precorrin-6y C5,15-methyltransferase (decarboxylating) subunit CbiE [Porphyromonas levii]MBR8729271.1 Cobalamin biosynthesis bifunctional protein CbiET [Porphyromonas levii]MBR8806848.1 Cobalamin biosynthesis bifunctional protein CbiET [Porphyromonas levii]